MVAAVGRRDRRTRRDAVDRDRAAAGGRRSGAARRHALASVLAAESGARDRRVMARQRALERGVETAALDAVRSADRVRDAVRAALRLHVRSADAASARNRGYRAAGGGGELVGAPARGRWVRQNHDRGNSTGIGALTGREDGRRLARVLRQPLARVDRAFLAGFLHAPLACRLRIDDQRTVDLDAVVLREHAVERPQLAEYADFLLREVDVRMAFQDAARVDRLLQRSAFGQFEVDQRLRIGQRVADLERQHRAHALPYRWSARFTN